MAESNKTETIPVWGTYESVFNKADKFNSEFVKAKVTCPFCKNESPSGLIYGEMRTTCNFCGKYFLVEGLKVDRTSIETRVEYHDPVRPNHYGDGTYETYKVINAWNLNFNLGNSVKYIARAGKKDPSKLKEDLLKAKQYIDFELERLG